MNNPIYKITTNKNFFEELAGGIINKFASSCKLNDIIIILPTKYACSSLIQVFKEQKQAIPDIHPISDLSSFAKVKKTPLDRIALVNKISQIILSMNYSSFDNLYAVTELAEYFADFLHKIETYQISLDTVSQILDEDLSIHKQQMSEIFKQFILIWQTNNYLSKASYNNQLIKDFTDNLNDKTIIIAGVNSNIPSINNLIITAANKANAYVILYGLDEHLSEDDWQKLDESHPQYNFKLLFDKINCCPLNVKHWYSEINKPTSPAISQALRPAKLCYNWHNLNNLDFSQVKYLNCQDLHMEAKEIIDVVNKNPVKSILIVTTDDSLIEKLILHLNILTPQVNIIRDYPLAKCKTAIWLRLCLNALLENFSNLSSLALFKNAFSNIDCSELELALRSENKYNNIFDLSIETEYLNKIAAYKFTDDSFSNLLKLHINFAAEITEQDIWQDEDAQELRIYLKSLEEYSDVTHLITLKEYSQLFNHFLQSAYYRKKTDNKRITLLKPLDGRLHKADLTILAGLNEKNWPSSPAIDPCFNSHMLNKIGLPSKAQNIGEEAYDFQCFASGSEVLLTRSEKMEGNITTPSRWLLRLLTLSRNTITITSETKTTLHQVTPQVNISPIPPLEYRPTELSVTRIEKLIFNPYHIYVDKILKLKKLLTIDKELSALDFGNFIHKALEIYHDTQRKSLIDAGKQALIQLNLNQPSIKMLWWPRFLRIALWYHNNENKEAKIFLESFGRVKVNDNFTMIATADRIEVLANQAVNLIDYKTGRLSTARSIKNGKTLQLLLEALICLEAGFNWQKSTNQINSLEYIGLSGGEPPAEILAIDIEDTEIIEQTREYLYALVCEYQDPATPYHYSRKKVMGYCEYEHLARRI